MPDGAQTSRLAVLMFTDVVGSSDLKTRLGIMTYAKLLTRHDELFRQLLSEYPSAEVLQDTGDGFFAAFRTVGEAVRFALRFQDAMHREPWGAEPLKTRIGIHLGELAHIAQSAGGPPKVVGMAADLAARVMSLARGGQILLTRAAFDEARQFVSEYPSTNGTDAQRRTLRWMAHGDYVFHGAAEPVQVFEVGGDGIAPLIPPRDREKAHRSASDNKEEILGWRPAAGLFVPQMPTWVLERKLGEGTFGEVWLARHQTLRQQRVFKFCFDAERLESFKRELTLFRLLRDALGERRDIAKLFDVCLDRPPYFLVSEFAPDGNLIDWANARGGLASVPLTDRLDLVAQVCDAVAAAHSVGVLHKDIKPNNILIHTRPDGSPLAQLSDFGIGLLTDRGQLAARQITEAGFMTMPSLDASRSGGTRIYAPPESLTGRPFTMQGDIYALGVLLYQMTIADTERPLALGWERDVDDELLRQDIGASVDGDPLRRVNSASDIATRLRALPERRERRAVEIRERDTARRRRRLLRIGAVALVLGAATIAATVIPYIQQLRLRASRRETQWTQAAMGLEQGIASHFTGRVAESRHAFTAARDAFQRLGVSTLPAEVGLYRSVREFDAPINTVQASSDGLMSVAFLPDGHRAAAAAEDGTVRLWDVRTGEAIRDFIGHKGLVGALAVSPDGRRLLTGGLDQSIRLWDAETGQLLREMLEPTGEVRGVAFSPDGKLALAGSYCKDATLRLWDLQTGEQVRTYRRPTAPSHYYGVAFSPDGRRILAATYGRDIWVWDVDHEDPRQQLAGHAGYVVSATFSPDGRHVLSGSFDQTVRLWDLETGKAEVFTAHAAGVRGAAFVDGGTVLSASMDGTIKLWDVPSRQVRRTFAGHTDGVRGLSISPDGRRAASAGIDGTVRVWNLAPNNEVQSADEHSTVITLSGSPDGSMLVAGTSSGAVTLRDVATLRTLQTFVGHDRPIECATFLLPGRLFTADDAGQARVWDVASGRVLQAYPARVKPDDEDARVRGDDWCHTAVAASGGVAIASNPDRRRIDVWSIETGQTLRTLAGSVNNVTCLTISVDGRRALSGDAFGRMYCWNLDAGTVRFRTEPSKRGTLDCVRFAPDGNTALSGGHDNTVRLWDLGSGRQLRAYPGHTLVVRAADFGRDGRTVFSAGSDQALRMFDAETGRAFDLGAQFALPLYAMAVIPPGDAVAAGAGRTISVWNVSRAARHVDAEPRLDAARAALRAKSDDAPALLTLGEWYAFRGADDWAVELFERARAGGANVSSLMLARCYWQLDHRDGAAREFRRAIERNEAPAAYLNLCLAALERAPATRPTTQALVTTR